jgi:hypothetical protein
MSEYGYKKKATGGGGGVSTVFHDQTNLTIDGDDGNFFNITISADETFTVANIVAGVNYTFMVYNSHTGNISITIPAGATHKKPTSIITISTIGYVEFSLIYNGTNYYWQVSEEIY